MIRYRFVTPNRAGKWYPDLATAQRHAFEIGAGFLAERSGQFCAYNETRLEVGPPGATDADSVSGSGNPA